MRISCSTRSYLSCCCLFSVPSMFICNVFSFVIILLLFAPCCVCYEGVMRVCYCGTGGKVTGEAETSTVGETIFEKQKIKGRVRVRKKNAKSEVDSKAE